MKNSFTIFFVIILFCFISVSAQKRAMTLEDVMKFKQIKESRISEEGNWISYTEQPDRGNSAAVVKGTGNEKEYRIERGKSPIVLPAENFAVITRLPDFTELEKAEKNKPKSELFILNLSNADTIIFPRVDDYKYSNSSNWIAIKYTAEEKKDSIKSEKKKEKKDDNTGQPLTLLNLTNGQNFNFDFVNEYLFDSLSNYLACTSTDSLGNNSIVIHNLTSDEIKISFNDTSSRHSYSSLTWNGDSKLAFIKSELDKKKKPFGGTLNIWDGNLKKVAASDTTINGWIIPSKNNLKWSVNKQILYFGRRPFEPRIEEDKSDSTLNIFNFKKILTKRTVNIWHWNDPLIKTQEEKQYKSEKERTYTAAYNLKDGSVIQLADSLMPDINITNSAVYAVGKSNVPYMKEITWDDYFFNFYRVDLKFGKRTKIINHTNQQVAVSPSSKYILFYEDSNWSKLDLSNLKKENLTSSIRNSFYNEEFDLPMQTPGFGVGGWLMKDTAVIIYDKYDIWMFSTKTGYKKNLTGGEGRKNLNIFRIIKLDKEADYINQYGDDLLLSSYNDFNKNSGFYSLDLKTGELKMLFDEEKKFRFIAKAKKENKILYSRESYSEFPDLWFTSNNLENTKKITNLGIQTEQFAWGSAELIEWLSDDGIKLQGALIKPGNYIVGKKYPVLIYYYELFSQRLHEFPDVIVNHRPNFALYTSNDYAIFLPDVRYQIGRPGLSALKCIMPGVQKIIDMGIADPEAIALHGHSWSGYQTAYVITQTNFFKCAIAGAPVSNMTSAYSGIRWGTGMARQFQYEKAQSRIGGSLWEKHLDYIENSPVFFADKVNTPLLIMHGDLDDAVPWYQSIELYLALRRFNKDVIFLQYKGEPHHPKTYSNKLDYSIKMKEYLDFHLKAIPAPEWIKNGVRYSE